MDGVTALLEQAHDAGLKVCAAGSRLIVRGPRTAEYIAKQLLARKTDVIAALAQVETIHVACPVCSGPISSVISVEGLSELFGCHNSGGEHWHRRIERKQALASEWSEIFTRCFNGDCPAILRFEQGLNCCPLCGAF